MITDWVKLGIRYYADAKIAGLPDDIADSAEVMWTRGLARAGEQRAQGFIPESAIPELTRRRRYEAVADALVATGLWSRVPGGYQVTRWADWQDALDALTKRRESDAERKRKSRAAAAQAEKPAGSTPDVSRDRHVSRDKPPMSRDLDQVSRDRSRDVTPLEGEKEKDPRGRSKRDTHVAREAGPEPPRQCPEHLQDPDPPPCGRCKQTRQAHEQWEQQWLHEQQLARHAEAVARAEATAIAIRGCNRCDHLGRLPDQRVCTHRAEAVHASELAAAARANIRPGPAGRQRADPVALARQRDPESPLDQALAEVIPIRPSEAEPA